MAIEWKDKEECEVIRRLVVDERTCMMCPADYRTATIDDLRRACEAAGLVVETVERAEADREDRTNLREAYQKMHDERDAYLDALAEHVSPDGTVTTPRMVQPTSVLAGIRSLQGRLRDARSDYREHDAELEAAVERAEKAEARIAEAAAGVSLEAVAGAYVYSCMRLDIKPDGLGRGVDHVCRERDDLRARLEKAERLHSEAEAQVARRSEMRHRLATLEADLAAARANMEKLEAENEQQEAELSEARAEAKEWASRHDHAKELFEAARARIAELEAPMPEATVRDLEALADEHFRLRSGWSPTLGDMRDLAIAVAGRVRRERPPCLIARAVAAGVGFEFCMRGNGDWYVRQVGKDKGVYVPAADVPATLARLLDEVEAARKAVQR